MTKAHPFEPSFVFVMIYKKHATKLWQQMTQTHNNSDKIMHLKCQFVIVNPIQSPFVTKREKRAISKSHAFSQKSWSSLPPLLLMSFIVHNFNSKLLQSRAHTSTMILRQLALSHAYICEIHKIFCLIPNSTRCIDVWLKLKQSKLKGANVRREKKETQNMQIKSTYDSAVFGRF